MSITRNIRTILINAIVLYGLISSAYSSFQRGSYFLFAVIFFGLCAYIISIVFIARNKEDAAEMEAWAKKMTPFFIMLGVLVVIAFIYMRFFY